MIDDGAARCGVRFMDAKWIGIGLAFGLVVGIATGNLGLWLGVGIALGAAFGAYQAKKKSPPPKP